MSKLWQARSKSTKRIWRNQRKTQHNNRLNREEAMEHLRRTVRLVKAYDYLTDTMRWDALPDDFPDWPAGIDARLELTYEELDGLLKEKSNGRDDIDSSGDVQSQAGDRPS